MFSQFLYTEEEKRVFRELFFDRPCYNSIYLSNKKACSVISHVCGVSFVVAAATSTHIIIPVALGYGAFAYGFTFIRFYYDVNM
jgi:hypothetical protein